MSRLLRRALLAAEIAGSYLRVRWILARHDLPATLRALRNERSAAVSTAGAEEVMSGLHLGRATDRLFDALPRRAPCLTRALVLSRLLDRRGVRSALVIGVAAGEEFGAHAWVEVAGQPVLPPGDGRFLRLVEL